MIEVKVWLHEFGGKIFSQVDAYSLARNLFLAVVYLIIARLLFWFLSKVGSIPTLPRHRKKKGCCCASFFDVLSLNPRCLQHVPAAYKD